MKQPTPSTRETTGRLTGWLLRHSFLRLFLFAFLVALAVAISWPFVMNAVIVASTDAQQERIKVAGTLGDLFGALTALVSFLTLGMAFLAAYFQREQLLDERQARDDEHLEQRFFSLLDLFNSIISGIEISHKDEDQPLRDFSGRRAFIRLSQRCVKEQRISRNNNRTTRPPVSDDDCIREAWRRVYTDKDFHAVVGHYFRVLYRLLVWIETCPQPNQRVYAKTLRAQLSSHELVLLFYNCFSKEGVAMKPLVERFHLLKHLPVDELAHPEHRGHLPDEVYADDD